MIKDIFLSFKDNFKEKTTNPFIGTYVLIWMVRNWVLWYSILTFDKKMTLEMRVSFIKEYYESHPFISSVISNIWITFLVLIISYIILNLSRLIVNFSEKQLKPLVYKFSDSKSIVLKENYELVRNERDELQNRLDIERDSKFKLESKIKSLEAEILEREIAVSESEGERGIEEVEEVEELYTRLESENLINDFKTSILHLKKGGFIPNDHKPLDRYIELDLLKFSGSTRAGAKGYNITSIGEKLFKYISSKNE